MTEPRGEHRRTMSQPHARSRRTLVIVVAIAASLVACGLPGLRDFADRSRAATAFNFLASVRTAQQRHHGRLGRYAADLSQLDVQLTVPAAFTAGAVVPRGGSLASGWTLTLTRTTTLWGRGDYTVTFNDEGFDTDASHSSILAQSESIHPAEKPTTRQWS